MHQVGIDCGNTDDEENGDFIKDKCIIDENISPIEIDE